MEIFTIRDFTDDGGYLLNPNHCIEKANKKVQRMKETLEWIAEDFTGHVDGTVRAYQDMARVTLKELAASAL